MGILIVALPPIANQSGLCRPPDPTSFRLNRSSFGTYPCTKYIDLSISELSWLPDAALSDATAILSRAIWARDGRSTVKSGKKASSSLEFPVLDIL
jgi:hypothetical protein